MAMREIRILIYNFLTLMLCLAIISGVEPDMLTQNDLLLHSKANYLTDFSTRICFAGV